MIKNEPSLEKCRQLIEASLHWGDAAAWTNEDFDNLSERIFDRTAVRLSVSTLKRIWGKVRYESSPTTATLNALARFAGFAGWREFLQQHAERTAAGNVPVAEGQAVSTGSDSAPSALGSPVSPAPRRRLLLTSIIVSAVVILIGLLSLFGSRSRPEVGPEVDAASGPESGPGSNSQGVGGLAPVKFEHKNTSDDLPNSVVFYYDVPSPDGRSVIIQQSWDTSRREIVPANGKEHTSLYYYPGYFMAKLIVNGEIRKECPVFIKTKGWKGIIAGKPLPVYLTAGEIGGPGAEIGAKEMEHPSALSISPAVLQQKTGAALFNNTWVDFTNVREFEGIPADHFTFSTTLRNTSPVEQCLCRKVKINILGTESAIIIPLSDKGCISDINLLTGDQGISGKDHDLSAFGCDFRDFQRVKCTVEDHRLKIMLNDKLIFNTEQSLSIGEVVGIRISFEGAGEIREVALQGPGRNIFLVGSGME